MGGQHKQAVVNLEKAVWEDSLSSDYYDWLGRANRRLKRQEWSAEDWTGPRTLQAALQA
jgi:hypothetical protein